MANTGQSGFRSGILPRWDLSDLYPDPDSRTLSEDLNTAARDAAAFRASHAGRLATMSGTELGRAVAIYEQIDEVISRVMAYAQLVHASDMASPENGRFLQSMQERVTAIGSDLLFFGLELNRIDGDRLDVAMATPDLARYRPWLRDLRALRPHQLSDDLENLLHEKSVAGRSAWVQLFDETVAGLRFDIDGETLTESQVLDRLSSPSAETRAGAARALGEKLRAHAGLFTLITNTLAKDKEVEDKWRRYERPVSARNRINQVEDDVVDALVDAVTARYETLSHRYYRLKARWFGVGKLNHWDRNAPLPDDDESEIPWQQAKSTVLDAYHAFSPQMADIGSRFFTNNWIDAEPRAGKASGAFSHPTVPGAHPYILMTYMGKTRDVMTLAHELGHGVHQILAARQGHLMADTPLTLAETASVFGEMLTFQTMLEARPDPLQRRIMLAGKVEDMLNTVVRQIAFHQFETRLHNLRRENPLTPAEIGTIWTQVQRDSLGPAVHLDENHASFWSYIPHFIHTPFYVYAYAFGDCLVNSLYAVYQDAERGFAEKYLTMLSAGGTLLHRDLLAPFGLDASDPEFWARGLAMVEGFIDELEQGTPAP